MRKQRVLLFDKDRRYAESFASYAARARDLPLTVRAVSTEDALREAAGEGPVDILLLADRSLPEREELLPEAGKICLLAESEMRHVNRSLKGQTCQVLAKYQSAREILKELLAVPSDPARGGGRLLKSRVLTVGVYSPVSHSKKTSLALALGQTLAEQKAVLYINFEDFSGFEGLLHRRFEKDLSDVLFHLREGDPALASYISAAAQRIGGLDFLPPDCKNPGELWDVKTGEWEELFRVVRENTPYEALVLDLGSGLGKLPDLLAECDIVYMPTLPDPVSRAKTAAFEQMLKTLSGGELLLRLRRLVLTDLALPESDDRFAEMLPYSPFGAYVRRMCGEDGLV